MYITVYPLPSFISFSFTCNETSHGHLCILTMLLHRMLLLHMLFTQQAGPEALVTHGALERLDVNYHVAVQAAVGGKWGVANTALEGFHSCRWEMRDYILNSLGVFNEESSLNDFKTPKHKTGLPFCIFSHLPYFLSAKRPYLMFNFNYIFFNPVLI